MMSKSELTPEERQLVGRCLHEAANGLYLEDSGFQTLIGVERTVVQKLASNWLADEGISKEAMVSTLNVLNNFLGYPLNRTSELENAIGARMSAVENVFTKLDNEAH